MARDRTSPPFGPRKVISGLPRTWHMVKTRNKIDRQKRLLIFFQFEILKYSQHENQLYIDRLLNGMDIAL
jgi:hypothetical protein